MFADNTSVNFAFVVVNCFSAIILTWNVSEMPGYFTLFLGCFTLCNITAIPVIIQHIKYLFSERWDDWDREFEYGKILWKIFVDLISRWSSIKEKNNNNSSGPGTGFSYRGNSRGRRVMPLSLSQTTAESLHKSSTTALPVALSLLLLVITSCHRSHMMPVY